VKLRPCLTRCWHCRIFFVADARNAGRKSGCPFGCAAAHRRNEWRRTSGEYYQGKEGQRKKSTLNQRRKNKPAPLVDPEPSAPPESPAPLKKVAPLLVQYIQRVVIVIEGRWVSREEILAMLAKEKRQHSMARQRRIDQIIRALHERPP
jgi:hypothetical protein